MATLRQFFLWAAGLLLIASAQAADIERVYSIPLKTFGYESGGSTYYKYGIHVGIGGGGPQLFEFDTGGEGFYASYSASAAWWGNTDVTVSTTPFTKTFGSQISYEGFVADAPVTFYCGDGSVVLSPAATFKVGQADTITQYFTQGNATLWPNAGSQAPVEEHFYGDFGLTLKHGAHGIENIFAQLTYGNGITGGYKVSLGPYGSTSGANIQVGLRAEDLANPDTIWFEMQGANPSDPFTGSGFATYSAEILSANMTLTLGGDTYTFTDLGINLDTGNPTPGLDFNHADKSLLEPFSEMSGADLVQLSNGTELTLVSTPAGVSVPEVTVFSLTAGNERGRNLVYESERGDGGATYLNVGALIFQQYDVVYDLENGLIGLVPVPEPSACALLAAALLFVPAYLLSQRRS